MNIRESYNEWADDYNKVTNLTRDLELTSKIFNLQDIQYKLVLELGCGTGKNTAWLSQKAKQIIAVDFSEKMLGIAKTSINKENVHFVQADITGEWNFLETKVDLVTCSLVLEHIQLLDPIFEKGNAALTAEGYFYIGELHPFKQYAGSKARFTKGEENFVLDTFTHNISEFIDAAFRNNFQLVKLNEWFDEDEHNKLPRILGLVFKKIN